jgi:regulator of sigma D
MVDHLLTERSEMLAAFCRIAGLEPYSDDKPGPQSVQKFCQILVDYIAAGHFALYDRIINRRERRQQLVQLANDLYPEIARVSDVVVRFNDKYDTEEHSEDHAGELSKDLSDLLEQMTLRIELEDQLIGIMYS